MGNRRTTARVGKTGGAERRSYRLLVVADQIALAKEAAERCARIAEEAVALAGRFTIALSGGSTPKLLYERLASREIRERIPWSRIEIFLGDERPVATDHPDSNFGMARDALLAHVAVRAHPMPAAIGDADAYERLVRERVAPGRQGIPAFDLILLGIGSDGHTASLFPGTTALDERERLVVMNDVPQHATRRMTFTYPLVNAARRVWVLATGAAKRDVVAACLRGADPARHPAAGVRPRDGELVWWLDEPAASALDRKEIA